MTATLPLDATVSHSARIWNYWLGGKDNYPVDREAGDRIAAALPESTSPSPPAASSSASSPIW